MNDMSNDRIAGIACGPNGCAPISEMDAARMIELAKQDRERIAREMPTEQDAIRRLQDAYSRLKQLGWKDAIYAPRGEWVEVIEVGSTGIHQALRHEDGGFMIDNNWPSRPTFYRPIAERVEP